MAVVPATAGAAAVLVVCSRVGVSTGTDPWITIAAAVHRTRDDRPGRHPEQRLPLDVAPAASYGPDGARSASGGEPISW